MLAGDGLLRVLKPEVHAVVILPTITVSTGSTVLALPLLGDGLDDRTFAGHRNRGGREDAAQIGRRLHDRVESAQLLDRPRSLDV